MVKKHVLSVLLLIYFVSSSAQFPAYIQTYSSNYLRNSIVSQVTQDSLRVMLFRTYNGLISFDAYQWQFYTFQQRIYDVIPLRGDTSLVVGQSAVFEYHSRINDAEPVFELDTNYGSYIGSVRVGSRVFLVFADKILEYSAGKFNTVLPKVRGYSYAIAYDDQLALYVPGKGFESVSGRELISLSEPLEWSCWLALGKKRILLADSENRLFLLERGNVKRLAISGLAYLRKYSVLQAVSLDSTGIAIATQTGGVLLLDLPDFSVRYLLTDLSGLPDNEIYAITADDNGNLWIVHSFGVSFVDLRLGIRNYALYHGLNGRPTAVLQSDTSLLVGTTSGLFYLTRPSTKELVRLITIKKQEQGGTVTQSRAVEEKKQEKRNIFKFFGRLFGNKKKKAELEADTSAKQAQVRPVRQVVNRRVISDSALFFQLKHTLIFRRIPGINAKVKKLFRTDRGIIVVTTDKIFLLEPGRKPKVLFKSNFIYDASLDKHLAVVSSEGVYVFDSKQKSHKLDFRYQMPISIWTSGRRLWLGSYGKVYQVELTEDLNVKHVKVLELRQALYSPVEVLSVGSRLYLATSSGLFKVEGDSVSRVSGFDNALIFQNTGTLWIKNGENLIVLSNRAISPSLKRVFRLFDIMDIQTIEDFTYLLSEQGQIYRFSNDYQLPKLRFIAYLKSVQPESGSKVELSYDQVQQFSVVVHSPFYYKPSGCRYRLRIKNRGSEQQLSWKQYNEFTPVLLPGNNLLIFEAENLFGQRSNAVELQVFVKPPFTQTVWFFLLVNLGIVLLIGGFFLLRQRQLRKRNQLLEELVRQRTAQIEEQNKQLQAQRDEIARQHQLLQEQNQKIKRQLAEISQLHREITDSIKYAQRIQSSVLPSPEVLKQYFQDYFLIYRPRDVVSGDFYWWKAVGNKIIVTVADCTGHGVPGAFLTMLGTALLNEITLKLQDPDPAQILNQMRQMIIQSLHKSDSAGQISDGMDMALIVFDKQTKLLKYSGAYNPVYIISQMQLIELKAQRMPIGRHPIRKDFGPFQTQTITLHENDLIYMFTDGMQDQFGGGEPAHKFTKKNFKKLLIHIAEFDMETQKQILIQTLEQWQDGHRQTDDITILGLKV